MSKFSKIMCILALCAGALSSHGCAQVHVGVDRNEPGHERPPRRHTISLQFTSRELPQ